ncbi:unnamed protein product [Ectocarpus sp. CCAP 1310/34]|nr:unnamed protein product [Ectocarpus sp. CCAP 1310/34]
MACLARAKLRYERNDEFITVMLVAVLCALAGEEDLVLVLSLLGLVQLEAYEELIAPTILEGVYPTYNLFNATGGMDFKELFQRIWGVFESIRAVDRDMGVCALVLLLCSDLRSHALHQPALPEQSRQPRPQPPGYVGPDALRQPVLPQFVPRNPGETVGGLPPPREEPTPQLVLEQKLAQQVVAEEVLGLKPDPPPTGGG